MKASALWLAASLCLCPTSFAAAVDLDETVAGHPGLTYFDLMKLLVPDLAPGDEGAVGRQVVPFAPIENRDQTGEAPQEIELKPSDLDVMKIPGDESRIVVLADLGPREGFVADAQLLALFSLAPPARLLDVADVGMDRVTVFSRKTNPAMLGPGSPLIVIENGHDDSDQDFSAIEMIFIRGDRFQLIGGFSTLDEQLCTYKRLEPWFYSVVASPGRYPALHVSVRERVTLTGETGCSEGETPPRPRATTYQALYRWDERSQRFVTRSTQLKRLAEENEKAL